MEPKESEEEESEARDVTEATQLHPAAGNASPPPSTSHPKPKCRTRASSNPPAPPLPTDAMPPHDPTQWRIETRIRQMGKSAGKPDTYYHHVVTGKVCRSKPETRRYQQIRAVAALPPPPPRPTLVSPTRALVAPSPVRAPPVGTVVSHQAVAVWVAAVVAWAVVRVASSPWAAARALFASTCSRRTAKRSSISC